MEPVKLNSFAAFACLTNVEEVSSFTCKYILEIRIIEEANKCRLKSKYKETCLEKR